MLMKLRKAFQREFDHCLKVMETAEELAIIHECDVKKQKLQGFSMIVLERCHKIIC